MSDSPPCDELNRRIIKLLTGHSLATGVQRTLESRRHKARKIHEDFDTPEQALLRLDVDRQSFDALQSTIDKHIRRSIGFPSPLTASDIADALFNQVGDCKLEANEFSNAYIRALNFCLFRIGESFSDGYIMSDPCELGEWRHNFDFSSELKASGDTSQEHPDYDPTIRAMMAAIDAMPFEDKHATTWIQ